MDRTRKAARQIQALCVAAGCGWSSILAQAPTLPFVSRAPEGIANLPFPGKCLTQGLPLIIPAKEIICRQLMIWLAALIALLCSLFAQNAKATSEQNSDLKDFLQNRPPISKVVFLLTDFTNGTISKSCLYEGGWNKENFYLKRFAVQPTNTDLHSDFVTNLQPFLAVGKEGNKYWHMTENHDLTQSELRGQTQVESNAISAHALNLKIRLDQTLNLGIRLLKTGTLLWNGDAFTAEYEDGIVRIKEVAYQEHGQKKTVDHPRIYGQLVYEGGRIGGVAISDYAPEIGPKYFLSFQYNTNNPLPRALPSAVFMKRFVGKLSKQELMESIEFLSIEFSDANSPILASPLNNYVGSTNAYSLVLSNNQYYSTSSNGLMQLLNIANYNPPASFELKLKKSIVTAFMVLTSLIFFVFIYSCAKKNKNNKMG